MRMIKPSVDAAQIIDNLLYSVFSASTESTRAIINGRAFNQLMINGHAGHDF
jgi:hypothetical protein